ncbi:restriction endonuclease subunit S [Streptomyces olivaceus]|uniref:restriction endonuclease subunit S n=1 Tax=Streptomyces olivaceus TaxID=47716 RepID=UPI0040574B82
MSELKRRLLKDLVLEVKPGFACGENDPNGVFQVRMNNVTKSGGIDLSKQRRVPRSHLRLEKDKLLPGDVLFNATNSPDLVGKTLFWSGLNEEAVYSNHFQRIRVDEEKVDPKYLSRWLAYQFDSGVFRSLCKRWVNQATVSKERLLALRVPLLPLVKQERLAAILDQVDMLRLKRREAIALLDDLAQSIFISMFDVGGGHPAAPLGEQLSLITSGGRGWAKYYSDSGSIFIRSLDVRMNSIEIGEVAYVHAPDNAEARRTRVECGDVLLTITGSRIGRVATVPGNLSGAYVSQHVAILRPVQEKILPEFLSFYLSMPFGGQVQISNMQYGQTKPGLNFKQVAKFMIPLPEISLQREFVERTLQVRKLQASHVRSLAALDQLFASLQHRAFSGTFWDHETIGEAA